MDKKIILFEMNEVPLRIIDEYSRWHPESTLSRKLSQCYQYETYAEDIGHLSPWRTWPTLHRGVTNDRHLIADFGQDLSEVNKQFPPLWQILVENGVKTGVCGSLHTYPPPKKPEDYSFFIPDTFAAGSECFPNSLELFQRFNLSMARESARNVSTKIAWTDALRMLRASSELGFRARTFLDVGRQLIDERLRSWRKSRRRTYQAVLGFDIFMKQLETARPAFSTFFTNHVAAAQHRFWAAAFPKDYEHFGYDAKWVNTYSHEIDFAMEKFDGFFGRLVDFVDRNPEYVLWVTTSMGQEATEAKAYESQLYLVEPHKLMEAAGLESADWELKPAMLPQCNLIVRGGKGAVLRAYLQRLTIEGQPAQFREIEGGFFSLDFGQSNLHDKSGYVHLDGNPIDPETLGLKNVEIEDKSGSSAYHIPQGSLLIYDPNNREPKQKHRPQVSTKELAPTILQNFAVARPDYMVPPVKIGA